MSEVKLDWFAEAKKYEAAGDVPRWRSMIRAWLTFNKRGERPAQIEVNPDFFRLLGLTKFCGLPVVEKA